MHEGWDADCHKSRLAKNQKQRLETENYLHLFQFSPHKNRH